MAITASGSIEIAAPAAAVFAWLTERYKLALIEPHAKSGRLVEIGPGPGTFALAAREAGYDVTGIEMDARSCEHLRASIGVGAVQTDSPAAALAELPRSNVIAMWHVLEHLRDPWACLDAAARNLEPGGVLAVAVPNPGAFQFRSGYSASGRCWLPSPLAQSSQKVGVRYPLSR